MVGRPKGLPKTGGRKKGTPNRIPTVRRAAMARAAAEGVTPLEVMLEAMRAHRDKGDLTAAASIAKDAAPYLHPRLTAVEHSGGMKLEHQAVDAPPKETREEWLARRNGELQGGVGGPAGPASGRPDGDLVH